MKQYRILVIDDDKEDHLILEEYFKDTGLNDEVRFMDSGQEALLYLESLKDEHSLPRLIVLDLNLPIMSGTQILIQLKQDPRLKNIPVIIYSTSENETEKRKCLSFGAVDYLVKPLSYEQGKKIVNRFASFVIKQ